MSAVAGETGEECAMGEEESAVAVCGETGQQVLTEQGLELLLLAKQ